MALLQMELNLIPAASFHLQNAVLKHVQKAQSSFNAHLNYNDILKKSAFTSKPSFKNVCMNTTEGWPAAKYFLSWYSFVKGCVSWLNEQTHTYKYTEEHQNVSKADLASLPIIFYSCSFERIFLCILWKMCPSMEIYEADIFMV